MNLSADHPHLQIREYRPTDFNTVCEIDRECFSPSIAYSAEEMALGLIQPGAFALVAEENGQVRAFALFCRERRNLGHLITIDVLPGLRRLGLGSRFMTMGEEWLKNNGVSRLILEVDVRNGSAIEFYKKVGFTIRRRLPAYYSDGSDALLMEKILDVPPVPAHNGN